MQLRYFNNDSLVDPKIGQTAACLTMGRKKGRGIDPSTTRCFWVTLDVQDMQEERPLHPQWHRFNQAPYEERTVFDIILGHHELVDAHQGQHRCHRAQRQYNPPHSGPWCYGDGTAAERWTKGACVKCGGKGCASCRGSGDGYVEIPCPGFACPFAVGDASPCEPRTRLLFFPALITLERWGLTADQQMSMKLQTGGIDAAGSWRGAIQSVSELAVGLGIEIRSWMGLPLQVSLGRKRRSASGSRAGGKVNKYPVLHFAPGSTITGWLRNQRAFLAELEAAPEPLQLVGMTSDGFQTTESVDSPVMDKPALEAVEAELVKEAPAVEVSAEDPDEDPRGNADRIREEFVESGELTPADVGRVLRAAGCTKAPVLEAAPWEKIKDLLAREAKKLKGL